MFQNIGKKIKALAIVSMIIGCLGSIAGAIVCFATELAGIGIFILIIGCLFSWTGVFVLYGFGELIVLTTKIAKRIQNIQMLSVYQNPKAPNNMKIDMIDKITNEVINDYEIEKKEDVDEDDEINKPNDNECPICFNQISPNDNECPFCGFKLK